MRLFITGATGYIGGSIAIRLVAAGHTVRGLVRDPAKFGLLSAHGIEPVRGSLDDDDVLVREARAVDGVVNAADADHLRSVQTLLRALEGSGKPLLHTSGSSVIGDDARGNSVSEAIFDEDTPFVVSPAKQERHALNGTVLAAAARGVRAVVVCPALIYGVGKGANPRSIQIPFLVEQARAQGAVRIVGRGVNRWSTVHIDDLAELYLLALERNRPAPSTLRRAARRRSPRSAKPSPRASGWGRRSVPAEEAARAWGTGRAFYTFGSNSRVRARRARRELAWTPRQVPALDWIRDQMPV